MKTLPNSSYLTRASGGYIITIKPMAIGIDVVPIDRLCKNSAKPGKTKPRAIPINIARKIQTVK
ncbi:conserved hypothetical protein [Methanosarcina thermophila]|uniref:Uncharacterized protein n=1 Tax=Methanosarcina thermophila TaxID=2210 RepID=A0A3G9CWB7_METTE|nr:conserved hypothetical protein [Methanosarcina thermophila]